MATNVAKIRSPMPGIGRFCVALWKIMHEKPRAQDRISRTTTSVIDQATGRSFVIKSNMTSTQSTIFFLLFGPGYGLIDSCSSF